MSRSEFQVRTHVCVCVCVYVYVRIVRRAFCGWEEMIVKEYVLYMARIAFFLSFVSTSRSTQPLAFVVFLFCTQMPEFYSFPPFFTLQPVLSSREKQLALWRELILRYHTHYKVSQLVVHDCPLWKNDALPRQLSTADIRCIMDDFVRHGHGEWVDDRRGGGEKTLCRILWRPPEQLAADIYVWAQQNGYLNSVCTLYELHSGEDVHGMSFQGADEELLRRALAILEAQGKCTIFKGETSQEDGIKFFG